MAKKLFSSTDADGSGAIDQEELSSALAAGSKNGQGPDAAELFSILDADGDGLVTESEHETGYASMHKDLAQASMLTSMSMSESMASLVEQLFAETDADGDESITSEELAEAVAEMNEETGANVDASELFSAMDVDGDGLVTAAEHSAGFESMFGAKAGQGMGEGHMPPPPPPAGEGEDSFDEADVNEDGVIDASELRTAVESKNEATGSDINADELFSMLDSDGDGTITSAELGQGMASMGDAGENGGKTGGGLAQTLMSSKFEAYRLMGMDAQAYLSGGGFSVTA
jgi:Ca2+-binding EF-hand superfamily protein